MIDKKSRMKMNSIKIIIFRDFKNQMFRKNKNA